MGRRRWLVGLFVGALAVRLVAAGVTGLGGPPVEDERGYTAIAHSIAAGEGFALPVPQDVAANSDAGAVAPRRSFRAPLTSLVLAPLAAAGGSETTFRLLSILLGAAWAPLLYAALRRSPLGERAVWAAAVYTVWPPAVYLSLRILSEPLSQALLLTSVLVLVRRNGDRVNDAGVGAQLGAGAIAGLAVLARPALMLPALALGVATGSWRRRAAFAVALVAVLGPWVFRNAALHGRLLMTTNTGATLVGGNSPGTAESPSPGKWLAPGSVYARGADAPDLGIWGWSGLTEAESDSRFARDAWRWVRDHPGDAAALAGWKLVRLFDPDPRSAKPDAGTKRWIGWLTVTPMLLLALAGAPGVWRRRRRYGPWIALLAGTIATAVVFYGDARMRTAADPALLGFAAAGAAAAVDRIRGPAPNGRVERNGDGEPSEAVG